jgi:hypothetical protein
MKSYGDFWCAEDVGIGWRILLVDHDQDHNQQKGIRHDQFPLSAQISVSRDLLSGLMNGISSALEPEEKRPMMGLPITLYDSLGMLV